MRSMFHATENFGTVPSSGAARSHHTHRSTPARTTHHAALHCTARLRDIFEFPSYAVFDVCILNTGGPVQPAAVLLFRGPSPYRIPYLPSSPMGSRLRWDAPSLSPV
eukprot:TRINITY_DN12908_c0_g1_i2.p3 TRINITY_DN12908_c0_g1~~TRINITY_DN12908_c0_g1_i2.p3  ORF type:complete len:107 (-),score=5.53 TRINITY_DN12908_c0_g1_i2:145-465(-)